MKRITIQSTPADRAIQRGVRMAKQIRIEETAEAVTVTFVLVDQPPAAKPKSKPKGKKR